MARRTGRRTTKPQKFWRRESGSALVDPDEIEGGPWQARICVYPEWCVVYAAPDIATNTLLPESPFVLHHRDDATLYSSLREMMDWFWLCPLEFGVPVAEAHALETAATADAAEPCWRMFYIANDAPSLW